MSTEASANPQPIRRWFQFSLRTLLISSAVVAICCWFGIKIRPAQRQKEAVEAIGARGGIVGYPDAATSRIRPEWLINLFGIDFLYSVERVHWQYADVTDGDMSYFRDFSDLRIDQAFDIRRQFEFQRCRIQPGGPKNWFVVARRS